MAYGDPYPHPSLDVIASAGVARVIRPAHTMLDGDTIFTLTTGAIPADVNLIGAFAAEVVAQATLNGVRVADSLVGWPAWKDYTETHIHHG